MTVSSRLKLISMFMFAVLILLLAGWTSDHSFPASTRQSYPLTVADDSEIDDGDSAVVINIKTALGTARGTSYTDATWKEASYDLVVQFEDYTTTGSLYVRLLDSTSTPVSGDIDGSTAAKSGFLVYSGNRLTIKDSKAQYAIFRVNHGDGIVQVTASPK